MKMILYPHDFGYPGPSPDQPCPPLPKCWQVAADACDIIEYHDQRGITVLKNTGRNHWPPNDEAQAGDGRGGRPQQ